MHYRETYLPWRRGMTPNPSVAPPRGGNLACCLACAHHVLGAKPCHEHPAPRRSQHCISIQASTSSSSSASTGGRHCSAPNTTRAPLLVSPDQPLPLCLIGLKAGVGAHHLGRSLKTPCAADPGGLGAPYAKGQRTSCHFHGVMACPALLSEMVRAWQFAHLAGSMVPFGFPKTASLRSRELSSTPPSTSWL